MRKSTRQIFLTLLLLISILLITTSACSAETNAIKVEYNGVNITFSDASPQNVNGRTMVPFRKIFETMGANVAYDSATKTIKANTEDKAISFAVGGSDITITENGKTSTQKMDTVPFLDAATNRVYVPVRFIAESMDCKVGWNSNEKTVTIFNPSKNYLTMTYSPRENLTVGMDYNLELMQIAAAHSADFKHDGYVGKDTTINKAIKSYFSKFEKNDYESDLYKQSMDKAVGKLYHGETDYILCYDSNLSNKLLTTDRPDEFATSGKVQNEEQLVAAVKDFRKDTKADQFFADNEKEYQNIMNKFKSEVNFDVIGQLETVTGENMDNAEFLLIASPSMEGGMALTLTDMAGDPVYVNIINPSDDFKGIAQTLYHEEIHNFIMPVLMKDWNKYSNQNFVGVLNQNVGDNGNAFNETVARALTNIMIEQYQPQIDTNVLMKEYLDSGWTNTDKVYKLIKDEYLPNRNKYKSIEDFMPRIVEYLQGLKTGANVSTVVPYEMPVAA